MAQHKLLTRAQLEARVTGRPVPKFIPYPVAVTQQNINEGCAGSYSNCPIVRAIQPDFPNAVVDHGFAYLSRYDSGVELPGEARDFIRDFDALGPAGVNPITFTVLIPQNYLV